MAKIKSIVFDWRSDAQGNEHFNSAEVGAEYSTGTIVEIKEHSTQIEGDKWNYEIIFDDGSMHRIFNIARVEFETEHPNFEKMQQTVRKHYD